MPNDLYDRDFVRWSADQARKLRRLSRGEQVNDIDWPNVVMEVADLGRSETNAVRTLLVRAMEHLLKATVFATAPDAQAWIVEADTFLDDAKRAWTPGMDQWIEVAELFASACKRVRNLSYREGPVTGLPACPVTLRDLLPTGRAAADAAALAVLFRAACGGCHAE